MDHQSPPSKVSQTTVSTAVTALLNWNSTKSSSQKPQLLASDEFIYLIITLTKIPQKPRVNAYKIPLPHALYTAQNAEICLFVSDNNSKLAKQRIEAESIPITKVMKLSKLKKDYKAHEQKRKLCDSYDLFLSEKSMVVLLPNVIGKWFYKKKKVPVPVELGGGGGNWGEKIEKVKKSGMLYLSTGSCCVMKVARATMSREEIVENVVAGIEGLGKVVPKGWEGVRSLHLKFSDSVALPLYQKLPHVGFKIALPLYQKAKNTKEKAVEMSGNNNKKKRKMMKGRIHEVRYMDDEEVVGEEKEEVKEESGGKKRKKAVTKGDEGLKKKKKELGGKKSKKSKVSV